MPFSESASSSAHLAGIFYYVSLHGNADAKFVFQSATSIKVGPATRGDAEPAAGRITLSATFEGLEASCTRG